MHRVRERLVSQRTGIINQIRAFLLNQRPDTLMQDRSRQIDENLLRRAAGPYIRVKMRNTR
jgi:hypothetical protein